MQINNDGIPLFRGANTCLWPILCSVTNINLRESFVVAVSCGKEKPGNATELIAAAIYLFDKGLIVDS